jgi:hypothetical protein
MLAASKSTLARSLLKVISDGNMYSYIVFKLFIPTEILSLNTKEYNFRLLNDALFLHLIAVV